MMGCTGDDDDSREMEEGGSEDEEDYESLLNNLESAPAGTAVSF